MAALEPALDLLLLCLGNWRDEAGADEWRHVPVSVWERTVQLAQRHTVEPLLYARIKSPDIAAAIPPATLETLQQAVHLNALKLTRLHQELAAVLHQLAQAAIPVLVLKGAYLGQIVYRDTVFRSMSDIDLLVHQRHLPQTTTLMALRGYRLQDNQWGTKHLTFVADDGRPPVEVHWHIISLADPHEVDVAELWARAASTTLAGMPALALSPEDLLLHLALHASFNHGFRFGLRPFCDIDKTLAHFGETIAWQTVIRRAHRWRLARALFLTLHLAVDLLAAAVPDEVLQTLRPDDFTPDMASWASNRILGGDAIPFVSSNFARIWQEKGWKDKTAVFLKCVLPPKMMREQSSPTPAGLASQWRRRIHRYGRAAWHLWRRDEAMRRDVHLKKWLASG